MFDHQYNRYMTRTIAEEVHTEIAMILWQLIDSKRKQGIELDYLQVFELEENDGKQAIVQRQEVPERKSFLIVSLKEAKPISRTVWCIDSGVESEGQMMSFPSDY
ncbi:DUF960 family protein [Sporosarcina ureae]|uniref:DUF960 family protein n=1 Tax=Sporosarcina ureae TaxID=1571 RepID=UPI000A17F21F|nr:DUF960 family protein [Sporosarcina ureae]ARK22271.1 hypothetical protein SporoP32a_12480 [Sporosarcina ureae]